jgi:hypothetical protein
MNNSGDDLVRDRLRESIPLRAESASALDELRPRMVRARTRRRQAQAALSVVGAGAIVFGGLLLVGQIGDTATELDVAGLPDDSKVLDQSEAAADGEGQAPAAPPSTTDVDRPVEESSESQQPAPTVIESTTVAPAITVAPTTSGSDSTATTSEVVTTDRPSTTEPETTTSETTTTTASSTTTSVQTSETVETPCGTLEVELAGSGIGLIATNPNPGMSVDVKNAGLEQLEVSFERVGQHCEVIVENRNGEVWSEVEEEDEE